MPKRLNLSPSLIGQLYITEGLTILEIAHKLNVSPTPIKNTMIEAGIPRRNRSKATSLAWKRGKFIHKRRVDELGSANPHWKGGRTNASKGYIQVYLYPSDPFYSMADPTNHHVLEHRLVMAQKLGRCLYPYEQVHHINGVKADNRPENLELVSDNTHGFKSRLCRSCKLREELRIYRARIKGLEAQLQGNLC